MVSLAILSFALMAVNCQAFFCSVRLPQDESWWSPCKGYRHGQLTAKRVVYGIRHATSDMPFNGLNMSRLKYLAFLVTNPFLKAHFDLWLGTTAVIKAGQAFYTTKHLFSKQMMSLEDYAEMRKFYRKHVSSPINLMRGKMKYASDYEPFQSDYTQWILDHYFAEQRLAGVNPHTIQKITFSNTVGMHYNKLKQLLNPKFNLADAVSKVLEDVHNRASLTKAIEDGRLYVLYHPLSRNVGTMPDLTDNDPKRTMWQYMSPVAIFASKRVGNSKPRLTPVAIQMDDHKAAKVFTPQNGDNWMLAKLNVQLTDLASSQIVEHLSKVHFVTEAICLSVERQLYEKHPMYDFMRFHCRGVFTANIVGGPVLLNEGDTLHKSLPYGYKGSHFLVKEAARILDWNDLDLRNNLRRRGVDDSENLPYYPYRDDGIVIFNVLKEFVTNYVNRFYSSNTRVTKDSEIQNFAREISARGGGKIRGFPHYFNSKASLIETFSRILWVVIGHHTSVNYPQSDYGTYVPNLSTKLYDDKRVPNNKFSTARLNNRKTSAEQTFLVMALSSFRFDHLFDYGWKLKSSAGRHVVDSFKHKLAAYIEQKLKERNRDRKRQGHLTYPYFQPSWLTNGIQA